MSPPPDAVHTRDGNASARCETDSRGTRRQTTLPALSGPLQDPAPCPSSRSDAGTRTRSQAADFRYRLSQLRGSVGDRRTSATTFRGQQWYFFDRGRVKSMDGGIAGRAQPPLARGIHSSRAG